MRQWLIQLLTDDHGHTDEQALISIIGAGVFFSLEIYSVVFHGQPFDAFGFGAGIGTLLGATSAGFGLRSRWTQTQYGDADIDPITGRFIGGQNASNNS